MIVSGDAEDYDVDGDGYLLNATIVNGNMIFGLGLNNLSVDIDGDSVDETEESDDISFSLGTYINDSSSISLSIIKSETEYSDNDEDESGTSDATTLTLGYKNVMELAGDSNFVLDADLSTIDVKEADSNSNSTALNLSATYYPMNNIGVGGILGVADYDSGSEHTVGIQAEYFVTPSIALSGTYSNAHSDGEDLKTIGFGVVGRF